MASNTVVVAFKHPGSLVLDMDTNARSEGEGGSLMYLPSDDRYTINGTNASRHQGSIVVPDTADRPGLVYGYGITEGVPADFWAEWMKRNARSPFVLKGLLFAGKDMKEVEAQAREKQGLKSGFDPLDQDKPVPGVEKNPDAPKQ